MDAVCPTRSGRCGFGGLYRFYRTLLLASPGGRLAGKWLPMVSYKNLRIMTTAALLVCLIFTAGVAGLGSGHLRKRSSSLESAAAARRTDIPALTQGLSRKRKGFDDAIALLGSAAERDQSLAHYYGKVIKRTEVQATRAVTAGDSVVAPASRSSQTAQPAPASAETGSGESTRSGHSGTGLVARDVTFDLNPAIDHWVHYYTETKVGRNTMQQGLERSQAYIDASRAEFKQHGLPQDLVWLAQVESVWKQGAQSRVAAGGIWQFMPGTATDYDLTVGSPVDERFDPAKETRAAAAYLRDLYTLFGNWELALAAYNCGEPRLMEAIVRCGRPDFWALYDKQLLPKETSNYVPKILAAIKVASEPDTYGFALESERSGPPADHNVSSDLRTELTPAK